MTDVGHRASFHNRGCEARSSVRTDGTPEFYTTMIERVTLSHRGFP